MSDIVERLITRTDYADREEAADEIRRLRVELDIRIKDTRLTEKELKSSRDALDRVGLLQEALKFYACGCADGVCVSSRPKFKGIKCGNTARIALEGEK